MSKNLPTQLKYLLHLKNKMKDGDYTEDEQDEFDKLNDKLISLSSNKTDEMFIDEERCDELKQRDAKLKRLNSDCKTSEELELLKIYRRIRIKKKKNAE